MPCHYGTNISKRTIVYFNIVGEHPRIFRSVFIDSKSPFQLLCIFQSRKVHTRTEKSNIFRFPFFLLFTTISCNYTYRIISLKEICTRLERGPLGHSHGSLAFFCWYYPVGFYKNAEPTSLRKISIKYTSWVFILEWPIKELVSNLPISICFKFDRIKRTSIN